MNEAKYILSSHWTNILHGINALFVFLLYEGTFFSLYVLRPDILTIYNGTIFILLALSALANTGVEYSFSFIKFNYFGKVSLFKRDEIDQVVLSKYLVLFVITVYPKGNTSKSYYIIRNFFDWYIRSFLRFNFKWNELNHFESVWTNKDQD